MKDQVVRLVIFASGSGSNAQALIEYFKGHNMIKPVALLSNKEDAYALKRAQQHGLKTNIFNKEEFYSSDKVLDYLQKEAIDYIILAGFLWLVPGRLVDAFHKRIINIHPALLPKFGGKGMYGMHVHQAVLDAHDNETGISIHIVNKVYDDGAILFQARCKVEKNDTATDIAKKVQHLEHQYFPKVVEEYILNSAHT